MSYSVTTYVTDKHNTPKDQLRISALGLYEDITRPCLHFFLGDFSRSVLVVTSGRQSGSCMVEDSTTAFVVRGKDYPTKAMHVFYLSGWRHYQKFMFRKSFLAIVGLELGWVIATESGLDGHGFTAPY